MAKKLLFVAFLLAIILPMVFAAGGNQASGGGSRTPLTVWVLNGKKDALDVLARDYQAANPGVQVTPSYYDTDGIKDALKVAASSRTLPDMWFNWGGSLGGFYAENNLVYDLTNYAKQNGWDRIFSPGALQLCTLSGKLAGYPTSYNVLSMYYRKDIFARYNLKVPTTFAEFETICATLKQNGIIPMATGGLYGWHTMRYVEQLFELYAGPQLHSQMGAFKASYNHESIIRALTKYKEFVDKGYFPQGFLTQDPNDTNIAVFAGRAAMDLQGQWYDGVIIQNDQDMNLYGTFPFPTESKRLSAFAEMMQFNANLSAEKLEACVKFTDYYYGPQAVSRFGQYYNMPLPRLDSEMPRNQPNVAIMLADSNKYGTFTITDQAFPTEVADELFRVQDGIANNQVTPQQGASRIQAAIEAYLRNR